MGSSPTRASFRGQYLDDFRAAAVAQIAGVVVDSFKFSSDYFRALEFKVGAFRKSVNQSGDL
jgi:hypothetical protein